MFDGEIQWIYNGCTVSNTDVLVTKNVSHCGNARPEKDWLIGYTNDDDNCNVNDVGDGNADDADPCIAVKVEIFSKGICVKDNNNNNNNSFNNHNNNIVLIIMIMK